ncbi:hypothetical protein Tsubulata_025611 [Turnera subulata]|uniref:Uncharacterized protein n=1 Tax=Turnera subulata TaxID=218843 RepID=A0A9Q0FM23_9ROSI|nr:hypothetical protein Tsubulata_025611 [Turnera subulata]
MTVGASSRKGEVWRWRGFLVAATKRRGRGQRRLTAAVVVYGGGGGSGGGKEKERRRRREGNDGVSWSLKFLLKFQVGDCSSGRFRWNGNMNGGWGFSGGSLPKPLPSPRPKPNSFSHGKGNQSRSQTSTVDSSSSPTASAAAREASRGVVEGLGGVLGRFPFVYQQQSVVGPVWFLDGVSVVRPEFVTRPFPIRFDPVGLQLNAGYGGGGAQSDSDSSSVVDCKPPTRGFDLDLNLPAPVDA